MTKPISRKMAVDCLLYRFYQRGDAAQNGLSFRTLACSICGEGLLASQDIQFDHIHADVFDGPHEYQNLRPIHAECHKKKTKRDVQDNAKVKRIIAKQRKRDRPQKFKSKIPARPFAKRSPDNPYRWPTRKMGR